MTGQIARMLNLQLMEAESQRATRGRPDTLEAIDYARKAWAALWTKPLTQETNAQALLGREAEARAALAVLQQLQPDVTITRNKEDRGYRVATPAFHRLIERYLDGLRKAGLPE